MRLIGSEPLWQKMRPLLSHLVMFLIGAIFSVVLAAVFEWTLGFDSGAAYLSWIIVGTPAFVIRLWRMNRKVSALVFIPLSAAIAFAVAAVFRSVLFNLASAQGDLL